MNIEIVRLRPGLSDENVKRSTELPQYDWLPKVIFILIVLINHELKSMPNFPTAYHFRIGPRSLGYLYAKCFRYAAVAVSVDSPQ